MSANNPALSSLKGKSMFYVYLLKDPKSKWIYIGFTSNLKQRLIQHKEGNTQTTRKFSSIDLVYYEAYTSEKDARKRERMLKHYGNSLGQLKKRISDSINISAPNN